MSKILFACGGTGGHVFPALAIAGECAKNYKAEVAFAGRSQRMEERLVNKEYPFYSVRAVPLVRGSVLQNIFLPFALLRSVIDAFKVLSKVQPSVVVGTGGYVSLPVLLAAKLKGLSVYVQEQNSVMGIANRIGAKFARKVFTAYKTVAEIFPTKAENVGNPVRSLPAKGASKFPEEYNGAENQFRILVLGGSQGAAGINRKLIDLVKANKIPKNWFLLWQCGNRNLESIEEQLHGSDFSGKLVSFIENIYGCIDHANLVVSRAGASTLAEILAFGKASILVPFPYATANHQEVNAKEVESAGAALVELDGKPDTLLEKMEELSSSEEKLKAMEQSAFALGVRDASTKIADRIAELEAWK